MADAGPPVNLKYLDRMGAIATIPILDANEALATLKASLNWAFDHRLVDDNSAW
ncbi:hypothetical protein SAMN05444581_12129 [Methylocapsa palsarum]|uniref:Uncharacterized protein n=1 Tax=Methylocapsa palsarum TaxID=1612308 RepID=A0A1I4CEC9_9HYPH|nr:hypothetical protein SAMN05444581_12129 [Methylocapsa palsarum]